MVSHVTVLTVSWACAACAPATQTKKASRSSRAASLPAARPTSLCCDLMFIETCRRRAAPSGRALTYAGGEGDAAGIVGRSLAEAAGESPADVRDVAVVAGGRPARARRGRVGEARTVVAGVGDRHRGQAAERGGHRADLEVGVVVDLQRGR